MYIILIIIISLNGEIHFCKLLKKYYFKIYVGADIPGYSVIKGFEGKRSSILLHIVTLLLYVLLTHKTIISCS